MRRACKTLPVERTLLQAYPRHAGELREKLVIAIHSYTFQLLIFRVSLTPEPLKAVKCKVQFHMTYLLFNFYESLLSKWHEGKVIWPSSDF